MQSYGIIRSLSGSTGFADSVLGNYITGVDNYTGMGQDGVGSNARFAPPTAMSVDNTTGLLYWGDALGAVRYYNSSSGGSNPLCLCRSNCTQELSPPSILSINCSQAMSFVLTGLVYDTANTRLIGAFDTSATSSVLVFLSLTGIATYWCGGGSTYNQGQ